MLNSSVVLCAGALACEAIVGYPDRLYRLVGHPVSWIGAAIGVLDRRFNRATDAPTTRRRNGVAAAAVLVVGCGSVAWLATLALFALFPAPLAVLLLVVIASTLIAQRSLDAHVRAVARALRGRDLAAARASVAMIVGRDTAALDEAAIARAAIESLAENFADGIVAPALWLALLGLPGCIGYKTINTADSMIGHRTPRHEAFGFAAARLDDIVNLPAARLGAVWLVCAAAIVPGGSPKAAWRIACRDARGHASPNAGWPEAAMAGALGITLGGPRRYGDIAVPGAVLGDGEDPPTAATIGKALVLYRTACAVNFAAIGAVALLLTVPWR